MKTRTETGYVVTWTDTKGNIHYTFKTSGAQHFADLLNSTGCDAVLSNKVTLTFPIK